MVTRVNKQLTVAMKWRVKGMTALWYVIRLECHAPQLNARTHTKVCHVSVTISESSRPW